MAPKGGRVGRDKRSLSPAGAGLHCSVPKGVMLCLHNSPAEEAGSIRLTCTSGQCTADELLLHSDCYDKLEKLLIQAASSNARCRNWSENQIRMNLWNKKVYDVIFRLCACSCGGFLKREEEEALPQPMVLPRKKAPTKAQLKPELKDVKLKKAKKLSSKSALSDSFKRHQDTKAPHPKHREQPRDTKVVPEEPPAPLPPPSTLEVYIPGLVSKSKAKKRLLRKTSVGEDETSPPPAGLNPGVMPFIPRFGSGPSLATEADLEPELFYSSEEEEEEEEEEEDGSSQSSDNLTSWSNSEDGPVLPWCPEAGEREPTEEREASRPPVREPPAMEGQGGGMQHVDSLIESIEILLNMDDNMDKMVAETGLIAPDLPKPLSNPENPGSPKPPAPEPPTPEPPAESPEREEAGSPASEAPGSETESMPDLESACRPPAFGGDVVLSPQWRSSSSSSTSPPRMPESHRCGCLAFPSLQRKAGSVEVWRREGRAAPRPGAPCGHCAATSRGQPDFLRMYQQRNGPFPEAAGRPHAKAQLELETDGAEDTVEARPTVPAPSVCNPPTAPTAETGGQGQGSAIEKLQSVKHDKLRMMVLGRLRRELVEARVKQIACRAIALTLENTKSDITCSN